MPGTRRTVDQLTQLKDSSVSLDSLGRPLLRVSLSDARALLRCVDFDARALLEQLFRVHWCWRPEGLRESKDDKTKTDDGQDVCVWGFKVPEAPPLCPR